MTQSIWKITKNLCHDYGLIEAIISQAPESIDNDLDLAKKIYKILSIFYNTPIEFFL